MQIDAARTDDTLPLKLRGRLDIGTAPALARALDPIGARHLVLDFDDRAYVSSTGLRELQRAQRSNAPVTGSAIMAA